MKLKLFLYLIGFLFIGNFFASDETLSKVANQQGDTFVLRVLEQPQGFSLRAAISQFVLSVKDGEPDYCLNINQLVAKINSAASHPFASRCNFTTQVVTIGELQEAVASILADTQ